MTTPSHLQSLVDDFNYLQDWEDRYSYIIDLGKVLPLMADDLKNPGNRLQGCQSKVWISLDPERSKKDAFYFLASSDSAIVRGLLGLLYLAYSGQPTSFVKLFDVKNFIDTLGLKSHLSPQRGNGLEAILGRIHQMAEGVLAGEYPQNPRTRGEN